MDIVERLGHPLNTSLPGQAYPLMLEAKAEIERLRLLVEDLTLDHEIIERLQDDNDRLRALCKTYLDLDMDAAQREIERLAAALQDIVNCDRHGAAASVARRALEEKSDPTASPSQP